MKLNRFIVPLVAVLFLASCNSASGGGKKEKTTSADPTSKTYQPIPSYPDLPDYGDYSGSQGIAEDHFQSFNISPNNITYSIKGESFIVKTISISPNLSIPAEELVFSYEINKTGIVAITPSSDTRQVNVECIESGDVTLTVYSWEKRYSKKLTIRVLPNDGSIDLYQPEVSSGSVKNSEKAKFGWVSGEVPGGTASGDAELGAYVWHYEREQVGASITGGSGTFKFGTGTGPEGKMTFSTNFTRKIKEIVIQCSSAAGKDPETGYTLGYGSSTFNAWFGTNEYLSRTVDGTTYQPGEECHTAKYSSDEIVQYHIINCEGKSGNFAFELGASVGAIYLKSILIEYSE